MKTRPSLVCHCPAAYFGLVPIASLSSDPLDRGSCQMEDEPQSARILITMKEQHVFVFLCMHVAERCSHTHVLLTRFLSPICVTEVTQSVRIPVLIGSGVTHDNVEHYLQASAMIIGSHFKKGGYWANGVDAERVKRFMGKMHELRE